MNSAPASSLDEGATVEDSYGPSHYAQRKDGKRADLAMPVYTRRRARGFGCSAAGSGVHMNTYSITRSAKLLGQVVTNHREEYLVDEFVANERSKDLRLVFG